MLAFSESALADADVLLYVTDVIENPEKNIDFLEKVKKMRIPVLLLINKIDQSDPKKLGDIVEKWHSLPAECRDSSNLCEKQVWRGYASQAY